MTAVPERVAIVGVGVRLPGAGADIAAFWADVAAARDLARDVPAGRWHLPPEKCLDPRVPHPDSAPHSRGYYLDPFTPDLTGLGIEAALVAQLDTLFHTVLDAGNRAWRSARTAAVDRSRVGVVLGNICLPTMGANALCREYLGGEERRTHPLNRYVAGLPAGVLAKALGLGGGSFTLDAACASSLYALKLAADELLAGRADAMLAGGANGADPQYTQLGFAQLRALSATGRCAPFDAAADGLMVGEGAAVFVLKRLSDALAHGDTILAVIAGCGLSNDMHGNLLAPAKEGQLRAMRRAYAAAGWSPGDVGLVECHATGTPVGDAVEFDSLRELRGDAGGRCVIGSVKSSVGHLLTGAGAAAVAKVLGAFAAGTLPPQANFRAPAPGLKYADGPFRVLEAVEPWERRGNEPRRAAVSGFGFGGVNAHLLLEEWTGQEPPVPAKPVGAPLKLVTARQAKVEPAPAAVVRPQPPAVPVAVVGMAAHFGPWADLRTFQEHVLNAAPASPVPKVNGWGRAAGPCPPGFLIDELAVPIDRFRVPPKELEDALPQQLLMLNVAAAALDDAVRGRFEPPADGDPGTAVFVGLGLDPNTTNYHLRWAELARGGDADAASPPLTANRVMGALGSIAASRIARTFHFGGPSHTVCSEEASAARAVELAVRALQAGEIDRAVAGGVELVGDPRTVLGGNLATPGDGAAAFVLKRLADAERDGDRVYALVRGVGVAGGGDPAGDSPTADVLTLALNRARDEAATDGAVPFDAGPDVGAVGAASAAASLAKACLALYQGVQPVPGSPRYWLHDRTEGPRRAVVPARGADGSCLVFALEEYRGAADATDRRQPLGARDEAVFVVEAATADALVPATADLTFAAAHRDGGVEALARRWFAANPPDQRAKVAAAFVARSAGELVEQAEYLRAHLRSDPTLPLPPDPRPALRDRVFYSPAPLGPKAKVAFVYPGSGNQFDGMGRDLSAQWPAVLRRQHAENELLRSQFAPELFWDAPADAAPHRDLMFGQVTVGSLVSDVVRSFGVPCDAMIGLSLGESAGLFGVRAWPGRDEMYRRMRESSLFVSDLAPPYDAARAHWGVPREKEVDWAAGVVAASADDVVAALRPGLRAYLLIVNTPTECVIGGDRADVAKLAAALGGPFFPLSGVTLAHCDAGRPVEVAYRELHTLPVTPPPGVTVYSGAWGKSYPVTERAAADSITAGLVGPIDVPAVVRAAYRDGVRVFVEVGPGASCTRMIGTILADKPHLARAAHAGKADAVSQVLRLIAALAAERVPVDLAALYGGESHCVGHRVAAAESGAVVVVPVGNRPPAPPEPKPEPAGDVWHVSAPTIPEPPETVTHTQTWLDLPAMEVVDTHTEPRLERVTDTVVSPAFDLSPAIAATCDARAEMMRAQETFLRLNQRLLDTAAGVVRFQTQLLQMAGGAPPVAPDNSRLTPAARPEASVPRALSFEQCCTFAAGKVGDALGPLFAGADAFPTRVRLPDKELQLVDAITLIEGEPRSMTSGRVVTTHTVRADRWYLESGRIPTAISVEAGQADLFLSGFLGIDFETRGLAVYRLLDAVVSFHRGLPAVGETVVYDIRIDGFEKQGDAWLFRFRFDGTVNGEPFITMRNGVAGFFTAAALAAGKGIVQTALDRQRLPGVKPADWADLVPQAVGALDAAQVDALRAGDLVGAFGPAFVAAKLHRPLPLPGGKLRLVDRVPLIDPAGGRFGIGFVRGEFDIHPDDWFLTCHFVDDRVMPGTLMYECCLHTLRVLLMRMGWVCEAGEAATEPVPGVNSRLKCRGQVLETTKTVTYEVTVKELGFRPEPYCLADALMYADGKPIVEITNMSLRMSGLSRERLEAVWAESPPAAPARPRYDRASILAFAEGNPSDAFGEPYRVFDHDRKIARLPRPPFAFVDRVTEVVGEPFVLKAGAACVAEYDVPPGEWYFDAERSGHMPFSVLLEIALQPCGWLAAYCGSALTSPEDLKFRNLGGKATQHRPVTPDTGTLTMRAKMTNVSKSAGMIIQHYDMAVSDRHGPVYTGTTYFGFFSHAQLANQVGIREAVVPWPSGVDRYGRDTLPHDPPFPAPQMRMVDRIESYLPAGGAKGLGLVVGRIAVDPGFWFFQAHFYQDPVWPGSLGLESFLQLLKYAAWRRWGDPPAGGWQLSLGRAHSWTYRGQVLPTDREVTVLLEVTAADDATRRLTANGFLTVDGRVIYQMTDFNLE
ncbi:beta-ketoacyl synthase N-terminal-like domain-containing protein [Urbifossiella limnaea]|uniref:Phthiocerol/phenolphthiocerol synthesis polyketide synthase type I PpsA n=1 Tax=Urbifossiella limnaea TaxID=2528023 RepID=A0A517XXA4_9BACT|nr:beta-ketoacyl synthase N-terminal-like domain-containing protein [Urbifossiella limnaea]QDU22136.1 Phthiocerol/phenolphthiocerol synthesis polyketide synthase type I PpsA [Urbifossiella limnaea]